MANKRVGNTAVYIEGYAWKTLYTSNNVMIPVVETAVQQSTYFLAQTSMLLPLESLELKESSS